MQTQTEISRESHNLFSAEEVAETIGADLETVNEWLEVGAIDRAIFVGGQFSKYELQQIWSRIPRSFKAYLILIPTRRKWLVSWLWKPSTEAIDRLPVQDHIILPVSDILARVTDETRQVRGH